MAGLIDLMRSASFNCVNIADRLIMHKETCRTCKNRVGIAPILKAATLGLLSEVKTLLTGGVDASLRYGDSSEISALGAAALMGNLEVVRTLLEHGVDVDECGPDRETALHNTVIHGRADPDLIDLLLSAGADIDARTVKGFTPLHLATDRPDSGDAAAILLRRGAAKDAVDSGGKSALHFAAERGHLAATRALLAAGADATLRIDGALKSAPLHMAAHHGQVEVVRELARHGVDLDAPDVGGFTALHHAAWKNKAGVVDALVDAGANVRAERHTRSSTPLFYALRYLSVEAMRAFLRHGVGLLVVPRRSWSNLKPTPLLHLAAQQGGKDGAAEMVDLLLRWGADESELDRDGKTAAEVVPTGGFRGDVLEAISSGVYTEHSLETDADRVRELLANAPADRAWRRRGLLILCLARNQTARRNSASWGEGKGEGAEEGALANGGGCGGSGGGGSTVPWRAGVGVSAAVTGRGKREKTPSEVGHRRGRSGGGGGGGSSSGSNDCSGGCSAGGAENGGGDFGGVVASLVELKEEGFFPTIVMFL